MLFEMQQYISSLVFNQVRPANVWWSEDYQTLACYGQGLELDRFRTGIKAVIEQCWQSYLLITSGKKFATRLPDNFRDDLNNDTRAYSFLSHGPFTEQPNAFLHYLIRHSSWRICRVHEGEIVWNVPKIREFLKRTADFNKLLSFLAFILPSISTRVTQFLDNKHKNDLRQRNLFMLLGDMFNLTTYHKMTNRTGLDACTPAFYPVVLKELFLEYLAGGCRDCEELLSKYAYEDGDQARALYST
jgi:hypothetical protein